METISRQLILVLAVFCLLPPCAAPTLLAQEKRLKVPPKQVMRELELRFVGREFERPKAQPDELRVFMSLRLLSGGRSRISVSITGRPLGEQPDPIQTLRKEIEVEIDRAIKFAEPGVKKFSKEQIESLRMAAECDAKYFLRQVKTTLEKPVFQEGHKQNDLGQVIQKASQDLSALDTKYKTLFTSSTGLYQKVLTRIRRQVTQTRDDASNDAVQRFLQSAELESGLEPQTIFKVRKWLELKMKLRTYDTASQVANLVLTTFDDPSSDRMSASEETRLRAYCKRLQTDLSLAKQKK